LAGLARNAGLRFSLLTPIIKKVGPSHPLQPPGRRAAWLTAANRLLSETTFEFALRSRGRVLLFLLSVGVPALLLAYWAARTAYAEKPGSAEDLKQVQRAVALDPSNPWFYDKLGLICLYSVRVAKPAEAVKYLKQATALAPRKAGYWVDLASACDWNADLACSDAALEQALKLGPMVPRLEWITANHYVRTGRPAEALPHLRRLLELSVDYAWPAFGLCTRVFGDPEIILRQVLPAQRDPTLKLSLADFLSAQGQSAVADRVWSEIASARVAFPFRLVQPYFQRLLDTGRIDQAEGVWNNLKRLGVVRASKEDSGDNLVFNGSFEQVPLNAAFDWRFNKLPYVVSDFQDPSASAGAHCLRIDFTVARNDDAEPVFELVPLSPNTTYTLTAQVRSQDITSESGPRLRVTDPACPACLDRQSDSTVGTTPWHRVSLRFSTGGSTCLVRLSVWRPHSRTYPLDISGSFWLDEVSIKAATDVTSSSSQPES
jgi:tetratricopeptide (TPR) repeat protein